MTKEQVLYLLAGMSLGMVAPSEETYRRVREHLLVRYEVSLQEVTATVEAAGQEIALLH